MNDRIRQQIGRRKGRIARRLDKRDNRGCQRPMLTAENIQYEIAERVRAVAPGGLGAIHLMARRLGLVEGIDRHLRLLKIHMPYHESDHVLNIAYNLLCGGTCLEHLEILRNNEVYLDALGARRIPDPTTAGDFGRRFDQQAIDTLQEVFNEVRLKVWRRQGREFFDRAVIDADGTMVETSGECKQGIDINHKGQWGYHVLLVSLAVLSRMPTRARRRASERRSRSEGPESPLATEVHRRALSAPEEMPCGANARGHFVPVNKVCERALSTTSPGFAVGNHCRKTA